LYVVDIVVESVESDIRARRSPNGRTQRRPDLRLVPERQAQERAGHGVCSPAVG